MLPTNSIRRYRRSHRIEHERIRATPTEVLASPNKPPLGGDTAGLLIITATWTGCPWGVLSWLNRTLPTR